jgi:hypothetical protein
MGKLFAFIKLFKKKNNANNYHFYGKRYIDISKTLDYEKNYFQSISYFIKKNYEFKKKFPRKGSK